MPRMDRLSPYRTMWSDMGETGYVIYASTTIVEWHPDRIVLRTGGWRSVTTKRKMNQAARQFDLGYGVHQRKGEWYVSRWNHRENCWYDEQPFDGREFVISRI